MIQPDTRRPRVVVVGAGFGGLSLARQLGDTDVEVLVVDRNNFHAFWPLLYQVGAAEIAATEIARPTRSILRRYPNVGFVMGTVQQLDRERRVVVAEGLTIPYDVLVLALGSTSHFFGIPGADTHSFPLKTLQDGLDLRNQVLSRFEQARTTTDPQLRRRLLTFVIAGGGPTGVEFAGALQELIRTPLRKDFPELDFDDVSVILLEALEVLLTGFDPKLQRYALDRLQHMGIDVRLGAEVAEVTPHCVRLADGTQIATDTIAWTAGVRGHPLAEASGLPVTQKGTVRVDPHLRVDGDPSLYVIGDLAHFEQDGKPLPMVAPVANQQAECAARNILRHLRDDPPGAFAFKDPGMMAAIGRNRGIAQIRGRLITGYPAWVLWVVVHLAKLVGFRNRPLVLINWAADYFFYERANRIIVPPQDMQEVIATATQPPRELPLAERAETAPTWPRSRHTSRP